jgi:CRP-like cAMP-binding protein
VTAVGKVRLLRLSRDAVLQIMEEQPAIAIAVCQTLSRRLRDLNEERTRLEPKG